jgi:tRNA(Ile)-lysidine synthase
MARHLTIPERVRDFLASLPAAPTGIIVAVSGGADSVALLRSLTETYGGRLVVAHFNHGLRGAESEQDAEFVAELAGQLRLPCRAERRDMRAEASGRNLEAAARQARYEWLQSVAKSEGLDCVATGHNANDQAETVLFHLLRGTGLTGLRGIARHRRIAADVQVIRPLLSANRADIERYLNSLSQPWRQDSSNADRRFRRNRIRHELLPLLERDFNPRVAEALARLGHEARAWRRTQLAGIARKLRSAELPRAGDAVIFSRPKLARLSPHTLRAIWAAIWQREAWPLTEMTYRDFDRIARWCQAPSAALELPGGVRLTLNERTITARMTNDPPMTQQ